MLTHLNNKDGNNLFFTLLIFSLHKEIEVVEVDVEKVVVVVVVNCTKRIYKANENV